MLDSSWRVTKELYRYSKICFVSSKTVFTVTKFLRIKAYILCEKMGGGRRLVVVPNPFYYIFVFSTVLQMHNK